MGVKISALPVATELNGDELFALVQGGITKQVSGHNISFFPIGIACSDETTVLTAGTAKVTFRSPVPLRLIAVRATLNVAQTSGSIFTVDINEAGVSILSTKITIDNTEKTSNTAAIPCVISDATIGNDAEITIDIDQIGDGTAKGLKIWLLCRTV